MKGIKLYSLKVEQTETSFEDPGRPALEIPRCSGSVFLLWTLSPITVNKRVLLLRRSGVWMRGHRHRISRRKEANDGCHCIFPKERSAGHKINLFLFSFLQQTSS